MKKLILFLVGVGLCSSLALAQNENLRLGLQLSPGFSWMSTDDNMINRTGTNIGVTIGAVSEYYIGEHFAITSGLGLAFNKGGTLRHEVGGNFLSESELSSDAFNSGDKPLPDGVKIKYSLQYLELPLGLKYRSGEDGYFRYFIELPIMTWGVNVQARGAIDGGSELKTEKENISKDVQVINLSWGIGAGIEYAISENNSLVGGLYFSRGLIDATRDKGRKAKDNPDQLPSDPDDDYLFEREDSKGVVNALTIRMAILF